MSATCKTVRTEDPSSRGLEVLVDEISMAALGGTLPPEGTPFGSSLWNGIFPYDYYQLYKDFVYLGQGADTKDGGILNFAKNKTEEEANTPFRTTTDFKDFYWDPILLALVFIRDPLGRSGAYISGLGAGVAVSPKYRVREVYIPGGKMGTTFTTNEYLSPRPLMPPSYETPVPRSVTYDVPGARGGFPSCIGPKIVIPSLDAGIVTSVAGEIAGIGSGLTGQIFPETNVIEWERRVISFEQKLTPGGYYAVEVIVDPPEQPDPSIS